jgi:hypothetical protein
MALANLASLNITVSGNPLILRPNYEAQILPTIPYGREVWSSETLRHHLYMLETSIARTVRHLGYQYLALMLILLMPGLLE